MKIQTRPLAFPLHDSLSKMEEMKSIKEPSTEMICSFKAVCTKSLLSAVQCYTDDRIKLHSMKVLGAANQDSSPILVLDKSDLYVPTLINTRSLKGDKSACEQCYT